jgi:hypothetical protein
VGAAASFSAAQCYSWWGWPAVCALGALTGVTAVVIWLVADRTTGRASRTAGN